MRKLLMSLFVLAGVCLGGALPASATAATGLAVKPAVTADMAVDQVSYRRHRRHGGLFIGFGYPRFYGAYGGYGGYGGYGYSRSRYYDDYSYRPYRYYNRRHHNRHHYRHYNRRYGW